MRQDPIDNMGVCPFLLALRAGAVTLLSTSGTADDSDQARGALNAPRCTVIWQNERRDDARSSNCCAYIWIRYPRYQRCCTVKLSHLLKVPICKLSSTHRTLQRFHVLASHSSYRIERLRMVLFVHSKPIRRLARRTLHCSPISRLMRGPHVMTMMSRSQNLWSKPTRTWSFSPGGCTS